MTNALTCTICGKPIDPSQSLIEDTTNGQTIYAHVECKSVKEAR
jgi:hypothetical protein